MPDLTGTLLSVLGLAIVSVGGLTGIRAAYRRGFRDGLVEERKSDLLRATHLDGMEQATWTWDETPTTYWVVVDSRTKARLRQVVVQPNEVVPIAENEELEPA